MTFRKNNNLSSLFKALFFLLVLGLTDANAQIYKHDFGIAPINTHPYLITPAITDPNLSGSSWFNSTGSWSGGTGSSGQALTLFNTSGTTTVTLTFNVANSYEVTVSSFSFWAQRSNSGPQNWSMSINGNTVGSGAIATLGTFTGNLTVATPVQGLTNMVTVVLTLTNASGNGNFRLDDFTLNGTVLTNCNTVSINSFFPETGPQNAMVTINGTGFTNASAVKFGGISSANFQVISDTQINAVVPAVNTTSVISVTGSDGCNAYSANSFALMRNNCVSSSEIYISELYDHNVGSYGMIELYNPTAEVINFNGAYELQRAGDIGGAPSYTLVLSGSVNPGSTYLVRSYGSGVIPCTITEDANMGQGINANDEFKLLKNGVVIDIARAPNNVGYTVIRQPDAVAPSTSYLLADWSFNTQNCSDLGSHTTAPQPTPIVIQPLSQSICENASATFTVGMDSGTGYTYQWKRLQNNGQWINVINDTFYSGATTASLLINQVPLSYHNNQYYCEITLSGCVIKSHAVQFSIIPKPGTVEVSLIQPGCEIETGSIQVIAPLGTDLSYSVDGINFQSSPLFENLPEGSYTVTVRNSALCTSVSSSVSLVNSPQLPDNPVAVITQPDCEQPTGILTVNTPLGAAYTYSIDGVNFQADPVFSNLTSGNYTVTVKNTNGCTATGIFTVNSTPNLPEAAQVNTTQPDCETPFGTISVTAPLTSGLTYSINGVDYQSETDFLSLMPGNYTVTVKNEQGCVSTATEVLINPATGTPDAATVILQQPDCNAVYGVVTVNAPLGSQFTYSIDGISFQSDTVFNNVLPGNYNIFVKEGSCQSVSAAFTVNIPPNKPLPILEDQILCLDELTGKPRVPAFFDTGLNAATYLYKWYRNGILLPDNTSILQIEAAGTYKVEVTDSVTGCTGTATAQTIVSPAIDATVTVTGEFGETQTIYVQVQLSGLAAYEYSIDGVHFQNSPYFIGNYEGEYTILVRDKLGCSEKRIPVFVLNYPRFFTPDGDGINDTWNIKGLRRHTEAEIYIFDRYGKLISFIKPNGAGWDGEFNGKPMPSSDYWFKLLYLSDGVKKEFRAHFTLKR